MSEPREARANGAIGLVTYPGIQFEHHFPQRMLCKSAPYTKALIWSETTRPPESEINEILGKSEKRLCKHTHNRTTYLQGRYVVVHILGGWHQERRNADLLTNTGEHNYFLDATGVAGRARFLICPMAF